MYTSKQTLYTPTQDKPLVITQKWNYLPYAEQLLSMAVIVNIYSVSMLYVLRSISVTNTFPIIPSIFIFVAVTLTLLLAYHVLCFRMNTTIIKASLDTITISHQPFPWYSGDVKLAMKDIQQFYVKKTKIQAKNSIAYHYICELRVRLHNGKDKQLLSNRQFEEQAIYDAERQLTQLLAMAL